MRWSYKTIHYELKKEGILGSAFLDEPEIELSLNQYGKSGWELVSMLETMDGIMAVFKQPLGQDTRSFTSSSDSVERIGRSQKAAERKRKELQPKIEEKNTPQILDEEVAEAVLLDEFEVVEDALEEPDTSPSEKPVDVGMIRIE